MSLLTLLKVLRRGPVLLTRLVARENARTRFDRGFDVGPDGYASTG